MGVRYFDEWVDKERLVKHGPLQFLKGSVIGIDAAYFLKQFIYESVLTALGGSPIALEAIANAVKNLKNAGIELHFVFNGLEYGKVEDPFAGPNFINSQNHAAFVKYESGQPELAKRDFKLLAEPKLDEFTSTFRMALHDLGVSFTVAPYSALAQLAYYEKHPSQFIDAVYGPSELFCFGVGKLITNFSDLLPKDHADKVALTDPSPPLERIQFLWIDRSSCLRALGNIHSQVFTEALILAGVAKGLDTFPPLQENAIYKLSTIVRDAVNLLVSTHGNVAQLCAQYPDPTLKEIWLDKYKQVMTVIKHHVVITAEGDVEILGKEQAPFDTHECIGLRLPEELYMYLLRGMIGTRVLNWLSRGEIIIPTPLAGADAEICHKFAKIQLDPLRRQALCLLTEGLHRYYPRADFKTRLWFEKGNEETFKPVNVNPSPKQAVSKWNVRSELIEEAKYENPKPGTLSFAVRALQDAKFAKRTITAKAKADKPLKKPEELLANSVWRLLQLRGYVDESHELTKWGRVLKTALTAVGDGNEHEEAVFLGIELLRFGVLNADTMFKGYQGTPVQGSVNDRGLCMLVSRVASLGRLRHEPKGYCGPLSRSLLAYHTLISSLQASLRDLLEMNLVAMFLEGEVDRDRDDWMELSLGLPFHEIFSCGLGIATLNYLDQLETHGDPTAKETQEVTRNNAQGWFRYSEFDASLDDAFKLWDAVYIGVKDAGDLVKDKKLWDDTDNWLSQRSYLLLSTLAFLGANAASSVLDLIPNNFDDVVLNSGKPALVEFFAPWCGHCKKLAPVYEELAASLEFAKNKVSIAKVDADAEKDLGKKFGVQGFPTLKWFDGMSDKPEDYNGGRDLESLQDFVVAKTGIKMKKKATPPSHVEMLTDQSFQTEIGGNKDVLVAFTAPWCGRKSLAMNPIHLRTVYDAADCKSLAPVWETVADDFAGEPSVLIAKVDAEAEQSKATAKEQGVSSYPTIKYFPKGSTTPEAYEGGRTEQALVEFMNKKAGTHRMVGGGLDAKAGTIDALDTVIGKLNGDDLANLPEMVKKTAQGLKTKYADYYVKVADKLRSNKGYVDKELRRLEGLIKKGGLAPEKLDDLTSRSNILRKFKGEEPIREEL
ncbi:MAG: hypothetical protein Q9217_000358 [Psora testacea]